MVSYDDFGSDASRRRIARVKDGGCACGTASRITGMPIPPAR
jgi:hypothetical protein